MSAEHDEEIRMVLDMAIDIVNGLYGHYEHGIPRQIQLEKKFWKYLKDEFEYDPEKDEEFQEWVLKATEAEVIGAAVARVLSPRMRSVTWDEQPWTRTETLETYADYLVNETKQDLMEEMLETMSDTELLEFMISQETSD